MSSASAQSQLRTTPLRELGDGVHTHLRAGQEPPSLISGELFLRSMQDLLFSTDPSTLHSQPAAHSSFTRTKSRSSVASAGCFDEASPSQHSSVGLLSEVSQDLRDLLLCNPWADVDQVLPTEHAPDHELSAAKWANVVDPSSGNCASSSSTIGAPNRISVVRAQRRAARQHRIGCLTSSKDLLGCAATARLLAAHKAAEVFRRSCNQRWSRLEKQLRISIIRFGEVLRAEVAKEDERMAAETEHCRRETERLDMAARLASLATTAEYRTRGNVVLRRLPPSHPQHSRCLRAATENVKPGFFSRNSPYDIVHVLDIYKVAQQWMARATSTLSQHIMFFPECEDCTALLRARRCYALVSQMLATYGWFLRPTNEVYSDRGSLEVSFLAKRITEGLLTVTNLQIDTMTSESRQAVDAGCEMLICFCCVGRICSIGFRLHSHISNAWTALKQPRRLQIENRYLLERFQRAAEANEPCKVKGLFCHVPDETLEHTVLYGMGRWGEIRKASTATRPRRREWDEEAIDPTWAFRSWSKGHRAAESAGSAPGVLDVNDIFRPQDSKPLAFPRSFSRHSTLEEERSLANPPQPTFREQFRSNKMSSSKRQAGAETRSTGEATSELRFLALCRVMINSMHVATRPVKEHSGGNVNASLPKTSSADDVEPRSEGPLPCPPPGQTAYDCMYSPWEEEYRLLNEAFVLPEFLVVRRFVSRAQLVSSASTATLASEAPSSARGPEHDEGPLSTQERLREGTTAQRRSDVGDTGNQSTRQTAASVVGLAEAAMAGVQRRLADLPGMISSHEAGGNLVKDSSSSRGTCSGPSVATAVEGEWPAEVAEGDRDCIRGRVDLARGEIFGDVENACKPARRSLGVLLPFSAASTLLETFPRDRKFHAESLPWFCLDLEAAFSSARMASLVFSNSIFGSHKVSGRRGSAEGAGEKPRVEFGAAPEYHVKQRPWTEGEGLLRSVVGGKTL